MDVNPHPDNVKDAPTREPVTSLPVGIRISKMILFADPKNFSRPFIVAIFCQQGNADSLSRPYFSICQGLINN